MAEAKPASSRPQTNTEILMDCQTEIKLLIKLAMSNVLYMITFERRKDKLIKDAIEQLDDEELKVVAERTLQAFARKEYQTTVQMLKLGSLPIILAFAGEDVKKTINVRVVQKEIDEKRSVLTKTDKHKAFSHLGNSQAKVSNHFTLFGRAEMNARHQDQLKMIEDCRKEGNLVVASTHSDCSDRCRKWQGRVYSLDGTSGRTSDGRRFEPLENARNAVGTKYEKDHNGLLGYNCRHKIMPYKKGLKPIKVTKKEAEREYKITQTQRKLEREIRTAKDQALMLKKEDNDSYKFYKAKAKLLTRTYQDFCRENNRVEYRSRLKIND